MFENSYSSSSDLQFSFENFKLLDRASTVSERCDDGDEEDDDDDDDDEEGDNGEQAPRAVLGRGFFRS